MFARTRLCAAFVALAASLPAFAATPAHDYTLQNTYADSLGGPSIAANGGTLSSAGYAFAPNKGLSLLNGFANIGNYSILLDFQFTDTSGYRRIIDFKNRAFDNGLYLYNGHLDLFPFAPSANDNFLPNTPYRVIFTRSAASNTFTAYLNGIQSFSVTDSSAHSSFTGPNSIAYFFVDNSDFPNEVSAGSVTRVAIYDAPLSAADVLQLGNPSTRKPGDANLNGVIDRDDFALTDRGFNKHLTGWSNGDFNGDNLVNAADYLILDTAFAVSGSSPSPDLLATRQAQFGDAYAASFLANLPEPNSLILCGLATTTAFRSNRRAR